MRLNKEQAKSLSNFFFDVAKGLVLGGIGLSFAVPWNIRVVMIIYVVGAAYICVNFALSLLEER